MITLSHGCTCSDIAVSPIDWLCCRPSGLKKTWFIHYRFYDPKYRSDSKYKNGKLVIIKGMNRFKTLAERREVTRQLIENELINLKEKHYNPIARKCILPKLNLSAVDGSTTIINGLRTAFGMMQIENSTKSNIENVLNNVEEACIVLNLSRLKLNEVTKFHIRIIFKQCSETNPRWSNNLFNHYRGHLGMVFRQLVELDTITINPVLELTKLKTEIKLKTVLTNQQRKAIDDHLSRIDPDFRRVVHIFFHSGSRRTELRQLHVKDVDLTNQVFKLTVKKGRQHKQELRPIKNIALPFWKEQMANANSNDYVFTTNFKPGSKPLLAERFTKVWRNYVKDDLGIDVDFYSLKHLNLDETSEILDIHAAAKMAGHTSTAITINHYAVNEKQREMERLKSVNNGFV